LAKGAQWDLNRPPLAWPRGGESCDVTCDVPPRIIPLALHYSRVRLARACGQVPGAVEVRFQFRYAGESSALHPEI